MGESARRFACPGGCNITIFKRNRHLEYHDRVTLDEEEFLRRRSMTVEDCVEDRLLE